MSGYNFIVPPRSWAAIEADAAKWLTAFGLDDTPHAPIMEMLELVLDQKLNCLNLLVGDHETMGSAEGYTDPKGEFIILREDVYQGAWADEPRDRFTAAHEFGHWAMHTNIPLARAKPEQNIKPFRLSEPQANTFASALLMPSRHFAHNDDEDDVMKRHGVGFQAARNRLQYLRRNGII